MNRILMLALVVLNSAIGYCDDQDRKDPGVAPATNPVSSPSETRKLESWYFQLSMGYAAPKYGKEFDDILTLWKPLPGYKRTSVDVSMAALYPMDWERLVLIGPAIFVVNDIVEAKGYKLDISSNVFGIQFEEYYSSKEIHGFFTRGNLGAGRFSASLEEPGGITVFGETTKWGFGYKVDLGYTFSLNEKHKLQIYAGYAGVSVRDDKMGAVRVGLGWMF